MCGSENSCAQLLSGAECSCRLHIIRSKILRGVTFVNRVTAKSTTKRYDCSDDGDLCRRYSLGMGRVIQHFVPP
jgi:hypothetical protein